MNPQPWSRRRLLACGAALAGGGGLWALAAPGRSQGMPMAMASRPLPFDPEECLRSFSAGRLVEENGRKVRVFEVEARSITVPLGGEVLFKAWSLNGRVPGPTFRARQGERLRVIFHNGDSTSHSLHFHGVHPAAMDGIEPVLRGQTATYEVDLPTAGLYPYHCHVAPVAHHVGKGMFGLLVVDPIPARPPAKAWLSPEELEQRQKQL